MNTNEKYMRLALELAIKAEGLTNPNPVVGAIIVKNGRIVGKGYHRALGLPHAEVNALKDAGIRARGATLYVTLEPCDHFGRTPPCTGAIIRSGIRKVVVAMKDPNPINNGKGVSVLKTHGIETVTGVLEEGAKSINRPYIKFITRHIPYITVKAAQSLDGKIATRTGDSKWITSEDSRGYVHELRGKVDAVMVGENTVMKDDPLLLSKTRGAKQPARIVVTTGLRIPLNAKVFSRIAESPLFIATAKNALRKRAKSCETKGANVLFLKSKNGKVDLKDLFVTLGRMNFTHILVEGGGELIASLLEERLADRLLFFIAQKIIGGKDAITSVEGIGVAKVREAVVLKDLKIRRFINDILIEAEIN